MILRTWLKSVALLFSSSSTLFCCALPSLLISIGAGATVASAVSAFPFLVALSKHKMILFAATATLLAVNTWLHNKDRSCPIDPVLARACAQAKKVSVVGLTVSWTVWLLGVGFALIPQWI